MDEEANRKWNTLIFVADTNTRREIWCVHEKAPTIHQQQKQLREINTARSLHSFRPFTKKDGRLNV